MFLALIRARGEPNPGQINNRDFLKINNSFQRKTKSKDNGGSIVHESGDRIATAMLYVSHTFISTFFRFLVNYCFKQEVLKITHSKTKNTENISKKLL